MSVQNRKLLRKRQDTALPLSGSIVESNPTPTASSLAQNTAAVGDSNTTPSGIPLLSPTTSAVYYLSTPSASPTSSTNSSDDQIPMGTVIGACVAAFVALVLAVLLAFYCSKRQKRSTPRSKSRNAANNSSRQRSHQEPWKRVEGDGDGPNGQLHPMRQRPTSGPLGAMFHRTPSNASGEKSSEGHNRTSVGTMQHFAQYHPSLAAEMASQGTITPLDGQVAKPPPALHLTGRGGEMEPPVSWGGDSASGDSFLSLQSRLTGAMSPNMMTKAKATPPATASSLHRWESAEVHHVYGSGASEAGDLRNPFADSAVSVKSTRGQNPFFGARDQPNKRTVLPGTTSNPFADSDTAPAPAIQSLIAALQVSSESERDGQRIVSVQSSLYSRVTGDDGEDAISVTAFPYPPTQILLQ